jgi:two-component system nitrogen regulation response regulator GlnG
MGRLLLVDDDPDLILAQIGGVFGASQHRLDVARTGEEGIRSVTERAPDVVLLDLRFPDLSGLNVYLRIRQIDARIPVLFITAATAAHHAIEAMKQEAYDYLIKPLDTELLRRVVGQALELSRLSREPAVVAESPPRSRH